LENARSLVSTTRRAIHGRYGSTISAGTEGKVMRSKQLIAKQFGRIVRSLREKHGIGLRELAKAIKISPTYLSKIERGDFPPPKSDVILKIAEKIEAIPALLLVVAGRTAKVYRHDDTSGGIIILTSRGHFTLER